MAYEVTIEGSGRHVHVKAEDLALLFGEGYELEVVKMLSQPGEFASTAKVDLEGPRGMIKGVSILGPCRAFTQVELSYTDARTLGLQCPVRQSGDIAGSSPVTIYGPEGKIELSEGAIIAKRHIHFTPEDAARMGVTDQQILKVKVGGDRALIFDEVVARVSEKFATFMHIDYDEANAASLFGTPVGEIIVE